MSAVPGIHEALRVLHADTAAEDAYRLIPSQFPPLAAFEAVAAADDVAAVMELEGWTDDRLVADRAARLP